MTAVRSSKVSYCNLRCRGRQLAVHRGRLHGLGAADRKVPESGGWRSSAESPPDRSFRPPRSKHLANAPSPMLFITFNFPLSTDSRVAACTILHSFALLALSGRCNQTTYVNQGCYCTPLALLRIPLQPQENCVLRLSIVQIVQIIKFDLQP